ncbi:MAG: chemotaxis protein CheB [Burkholderiaceae bacterium]
MNDHPDIVVIGASAGGIATVGILLAQLPADLPAAVFIVQHISPSSTVGPAGIWSRQSLLPVRCAADGDEIRPGTVLVAPADRHLLLTADRVSVVMGPRENRVRPAIDALFRSAAVEHGARVISVVLTGLLDDGSAGLLAIRRCNGLTLVQDPADAFNPEMPEHALRTLKPDHVLPVRAMGAVIDQACRRPAPASVPPPMDLVREVAIAGQIGSDVDTEQEIGELVPLGCPECGGPLWQIHDPKSLRFRCHVGHGFNSASLLAEQRQATERMLWAALRSLEEQSRLHARLAHQERQQGRIARADEFDERAGAAQRHALSIRRLLAGQTPALTDIEAA